MMMLTLLERLDIPRSERDPDLVNLGTTSTPGLLKVVFVVHFGELRDLGET